MRQPTAGPDRALRDWTPAAAHLDALRTEYLAFIASCPDTAARRDGGPEHLTASCFVLTPDLSEVLLCFHRKGRFWVQLGGHIEPDDRSPAAAALREACEEGGVIDLTPAEPILVDLDRHALSTGFGRCRVHWDIGFVAFAAAGAVPVVSAESEDVAWWPVDALPDAVPEGFADRLATVLAEIAEARAGVEPSSGIPRATVEWPRA